DLLAADIATDSSASDSSGDDSSGGDSSGGDSSGGDPSSGGGVFPVRRTFDPYFSHSWASGFSEFASGNNQESSSEAVTAWAGLRLWADASGNGPLASEAAWMQSAEAASALAYWVDPALTGEQFQGFQRDMVSLNWGGKRDFATWFSAEPSAVIGIQLIPMSPSSGYLAGAGSGGTLRITTLSDAALGAGPAASLSDYALMYRALAGASAAQDALTEARRIPQTVIDNGNSRTYLLAYIMSAAGRAS
ncbi:MAG: 1,3-beta-glucanase, partial [Micrococcales bacterium]|nr:1,3-beta-glucanase [Micrococcales bacterium]